ncbi:hypothetical protein ACE7GA_01380 [Roseomonas sp. CCTCC AB2023176]|uniref:hypothetical protein n=1 Tax=Roseomonas sp. CCTCC AB2023176 TaxID=3342640 RepID=UPI0035D9FE6B
MPTLAAEILPAEADPAALVEILRRRSGPVSLVSLPELERTLRDGIAARLDVDTATLALRGAGHQQQDLRQQTDHPLGMARVL